VRLDARSRDGGDAADPDSILSPIEIQKICREVRRGREVETGEEVAGRLPGKAADFFHIEGHGDAEFDFCPSG